MWGGVCTPRGVLGGGWGGRGACTRAVYDISSVQASLFLVFCYPTGLSTPPRPVDPSGVSVAGVEVSQTHDDLQQHKSSVPFFSPHGNIPPTSLTGGMRTAPADRPPLSSPTSFHSSSADTQTPSRGKIQVVIHSSCSSFSESFTSSTLLQPEPVTAVSAKGGAKERPIFVQGAKTSSDIPSSCFRGFPISRHAARRLVLPSSAPSSSSTSVSPFLGPVTGEDSSDASSNPSQPSRPTKTIHELVEDGGDDVGDCGLSEFRGEKTSLSRQKTTDRLPGEEPGSTCFFPGASSGSRGGAGDGKNLFNEGPTHATAKTTEASLSSSGSQPLSGRTQPSCSKASYSLGFAQLRGADNTTHSTAERLGDSRPEEVDQQVEKRVEVTNDKNVLFAVPRLHRLPCTVGEEDSSQQIEKKERDFLGERTRRRQAEDSSSEHVLCPPLRSTLEELYKEVENSCMPVGHVYHLDLYTLPSLCRYIQGALGYPSDLIPSTIEMSPEHTRNQMNATAGGLLSFQPRELDLDLFRNLPHSLEKHRVLVARLKCLWDAELTQIMLTFEVETEAQALTGFLCGGGRGGRSSLRVHGKKATVSRGGQLYQDTVPIQVTHTESRGGVGRNRTDGRGAASECVCGRV